MQKKLFFITAVGILLGSITLPASIAYADDPPIWGVCPVGSTTCTPTTP